jgi:hypothetical protein
MCSPERSEYSYVYWSGFCVKAKSCSTSDLIRRSSAGIRTITSEFVPGDPFYVISHEVQGAVIR